MALSAAQYAQLKLNIRAFQSANRYTVANLSEADLLAFWNQLVTDSASAVALPAAQDEAVDRTLRAMLCANNLTVGLSDSDWASLFTQLSTDSSGISALPAGQYAALKLQLRALISGYRTSPFNLSEADLLGYLKPRVSATFDFSTLFTGSRYFVLQGDRGIAQSGGIITGVTDQAGGLVFASTSGGQRPTVGTGFNGHASIVFDGVNDEIHSAVTLPQPGTTPYYMYVVFKPTTRVGQSNYFGGGSGGGVIYSFTGNVDNLTQGCGSVGNVGSMTNALTRVYAEFTGSIADRLKIGSGAFITGTSSGNTADTVASVGAIPAGVVPANMEFVLGGMSTGVLSAPALAALDAQVNSYWGGVLV